uniref:SURF1-like protein n=1 Tax=Hirondellea gigas TaxID=1518452 RepID=A0A2P2I1S6_9CRUS
MLRCLVRAVAPNAAAAGVRIPIPVLHVVSPITLQQQTRCIQAVSSIKSRRKLGGMSYFLLIIPGAAFCLGCWQVQRRQWKLGLVKEMKDRLALEPVPLPRRLSEVAELEYKRVFITGTFDHSREILMGPRPAIRDGRYNETSTMLSTPSSGFLVITPFILADDGPTILVNRGWVSKRFKEPQTRREGQVRGQQQLTGVVRLQEDRGVFMPKSLEKVPFFLYRDINTMSILRETSPVFVDACENVADGPLAGQTRVTLRNEHLSYLLTWYSLSLVTGCMWYKRFINRLAFI